MSYIKIREFIIWIMILLVVALGFYLVNWTHSQGYQCLSNPYNYSMALLAESNGADVSCVCNVQKPNGATVIWDKNGFSKFANVTVTRSNGFENLNLSLLENAIDEYNTSNDGTVKANN